MVRPPPIGLLPAAGRALRFGAAGYAKELFPILPASRSPDEAMAPRPICELALEAIRATGAERCMVVVSPEKAEILRVLGHRTGGGLALAYVVQRQPDGLPDAIRCAAPWLDDHDVVFAMPDTVVTPPDGLARVHAHRVATGADLVLGVFPVENPEALGPVVVSSDGRVQRVEDKPAAPGARNSWAIAAWSARFTELVVAWDLARAGERERVLGHVFAAACQAGLDVRAVCFDEPAASFLDIGTPRGLRRALRRLAELGVVDGGKG